jgi:hypothetical protein
MVFTTKAGFAKTFFKIAVATRGQPVDTLPLRKRIGAHAQQSATLTVLHRHSALLPCRSVVRSSSSSSDASCSFGFGTFDVRLVWAQHCAFVASESNRC